MINILSGPKGSGKTQELIRLANDDLVNEKGLIVYIDKGSKYRLQINNQIKFVDAVEYHIKNGDVFKGFLYGLVAGNYDISSIYIDCIEDLIDAKCEECVKKFLQRLDRFSEKYDVKIHVALNESEQGNSAELGSYVFQA